MFSEQGESSTYSGAGSSTYSGAGSYGQVNTVSYIKSLSLLCCFLSALGSIFQLFLSDDHGNAISPFVSIYLFIPLQLHMFP